MKECPHCGAKTSGRSCGMCGARLVDKALDKQKDKKKKTPYKKPKNFDPYKIDEDDY